MGFATVGFWISYQEQMQNAVAVPAICRKKQPTFLFLLDSCIWNLRNGNTVLILEFLVPSMYFFTDQTIDTHNFERAFAITFHDRTAANPQADACYTTKGSYSHCPTSHTGWTHADEDGNICLQRVVSHLPVTFRFFFIVMHWIHFGSPFGNIWYLLLRIMLFFFFKFNF